MTDELLRPSLRRMPASRGALILVVEDEQASRLLVTQLLERESIESSPPAMGRRRFEPWQNTRRIWFCWMSDFPGSTDTR